jgi:hypothetical protein
MTDDELAKKLHELKRRREKPLSLIEMRYSLSPPDRAQNRSAKRSHEIIATPGCLPATRIAGVRSRPKAVTRAVSGLGPVSSATTATMIESCSVWPEARFGGASGGLPAGFFGTWRAAVFARTTAGRTAGASLGDAR